MTTIVESRPPVMGQDHSYRLDPVPAAGCEVRWQINGQDVTVGTRGGGLEVQGMGATREMSVEVVGDFAGARVTVIITCPNLPTERISMAVGTGSSAVTAPVPGPVIAPVPGNGGPAPVPDATPGDEWIDEVTFQAWPWPWWRRILGLCPKACEEPEGGSVTGFPPFYYSVTCRCGGRLLTWKLSFGIILERPS